MTAQDAELVQSLLAAYAEGVFPMAEPGGRVFWYDPDPRGVIPLEENALRISRSLRRTLRSGKLRITTDLAFDRVILACAAPRPDQPGGTWIDDRIVHAYRALFDAGHAHSVEAWLETTRPETGNIEPPEAVLVGGLYGVHLHGLFAGESMFSRPDLGGTDASKVCLVALWHHLRARGFSLLDTQFMTPHLASLGGIEISRDSYRERLAEALARPTQWLPFTAPPTPSPRQDPPA
jgi:leucyl/phenylalanyl-tRNA--protein transferase